MSIKYFDENELNRWFKDDGDNTHRLNYDLNENSIVLDIGDYTGYWSEKIYEKYKCKIHIYEPVISCFNLITDRFKDNKDVKLYNFGASNKDTEALITYNDASSSLFIEGNSKEKIKLMDINKIIESLSTSVIDLVKINIEGSEFEVMEHIEDNNIQKIKNFQIQFHKIVNNFEERRNNIRSRLSKTHEITYNYDFVWENWKKI